MIKIKDILNDEKKCQTLVKKRKKKKHILNGKKRKK